VPSMRLAHALSLFVCGICFLWAGWQAPMTYVDLKQYLLKDQYRLVDFEIESLRVVNLDDYSATALGTVEGRHEEMGLGHFFLGSPILPAEAEARFPPGGHVQVYYNPDISNFTVNDRTARFVPPERFKRLTIWIQLRMILLVYGPLLLSLVAWLVLRRYWPSMTPNRPSPNR
jgi:hypothetical protein